MVRDRRIEYKKSLFKETIDTLNEINDNQYPKYTFRIKSANTYNVKDIFEYVGLRLNKYSIRLKTQNMNKPEKLYIAGS